MFHMKKSLILLLLCLSVLITASPVQAAQVTPPPTTICQQIFGGGPSCEQSPSLSINKQVQNPQTKVYVESLQATDPLYSTGQTVSFKLTITNTDNSQLSRIVVRDVLPTPLTFSKGPGKYDAKTRTLQFTIDKLKSRESKTFFIEGSVEMLPSHQQQVCVINQALASANGNQSQDNTKVCLTPTQQTQKTNLLPTTAPLQNKQISKGGLPIYPPSQTKTTPGTGPEALALIGLLPLGALGFFLRNKAKTVFSCQVMIPK